MLFASLMCVLISTCVFAAGGTLPGSGTEADPYLIEDLADFDAFADSANAATYWAAGIHTKLMTDIDLSGRTYTTAVIAPDTETPFSGYFDGNSHCISNFTRETNVGGIGLFGYVWGVDCKIKNLAFEHPYIYAPTGNKVGVLAGQNYAEISDCRVSGGVVHGSDWVGGLVGSSQGNLLRCHGDIQVIGDSYAVGGLVGECIFASIYDSYSQGTCTGDDTVGGLVGFVNGPEISNCYSIAVVNGNTAVGSLVGQSHGTEYHECFINEIINHDVNAVGEWIGEEPNVYVRNTIQLQTQSTFTDAGWDFTGTWFMSGYPALSWQADFGGGDGSETNPYLIENMYDFDKFSSDPTYWAAGVHTKLMTDIDLAGRTYTTAVIAPDVDTASGYQGTYYSGVFDGNDFTISNLTINTAGAGNNYLALFGKAEGVTAEVKNLGVENITITGGSTSRYAGSLVGINVLGYVKNCHSHGSISVDGIVGGLVGTSSGSVENSYSTGIATGAFDIGGLVGLNDSGSIINCYSTCNVIGNPLIPVVAPWNFGGLVAENSGNVTNCFAAGDVSGIISTGGLTGQNHGTIQRCFATGNVRGSSSVGGVVGSNGSSANILMCYSNGDVLSQSDAGNSSAGGIVGSTGGAGLISHCYAAGLISGTGYVGGIMGIEHNYANYENCFWDITKNPSLQDSGSRGEVADIFAENTANLKTQSTFINWDFSTPVWIMLREGEDYPRLAWQEVFLGDIAGLYGVDMVDFAYLANYWGLTGCNSGTDCGRADIDDSGDVGLGDLVYVAQDWLE